jgi:hypothetical protein
LGFLSAQVSEKQWVLARALVLAPHSEQVSVMLLAPLSAQVSAQVSAPLSV